MEYRASRRLRIDQWSLERKIAWVLAFWTAGLGIAILLMWLAGELPN